MSDQISTIILCPSGDPTLCVGLATDGTHFDLVPCYDRLREVKLYEVQSGEFTYVQVETIQEDSQTVVGINADGLVLSTDIKDPGSFFMRKPIDADSFGLESAANPGNWLGFDIGKMAVVIVARGEVSPPGFVALAPAEFGDHLSLPDVPSSPVMGDPLAFPAVPSSSLEATPAGRARVLIGDSAPAPPSRPAATPTSAATPSAPPRPSPKASIADHILPPVARAIEGYITSLPPAIADLHSGLPHGITSAQRDFFRRQGYLLLRGAVDAAHVRAARELIDRHITEAKPDIFGQAQLSEGVAADPAIVALMTETSTWRALQHLIGPKLIPPNKAQLAVRPPSNPADRLDVRWLTGVQRWLEEHNLPVGAELTDKISAASAADRPLDPKDWHIDGMLFQRPCMFTCLVGIMLSDVSSIHCGNFTVFPGSHIPISRHLASGGQVGLLNKPELSIEPLQVTANAGDVILAHPLLAHRAGPNHSEATRCAAFFRLGRLDHAAMENQMPQHPWIEFDGMNV